MRAKRLPIILITLFAASLACNLGATQPTAAATQGNVLTQAAETLAAQTPTNTPGITVEQALTLAVETLQAQASPTPPPQVVPPTAKASKTKKPTPQPATPTATSAPAGTQPPFHINLTLVGKIGPIGGIELAKLDYTANPNYGIANLSGGFSPDPYTVGMTSGGNVNVSYLGSSCSGFASPASDLRINLGGSAPLLRIYFVATNGDSTIVVNDPYGNYYCVDDSFGTVNPTIDFNNPAGGSYNVWVASYAANTHVTGTLSITGSSANHP